LIAFGSFYESFKRYYDDPEFNKKKKKDDFDDLISGIMLGSYVREKDKDFLIHKDSRKVNLTYSSSGQQETLPLIVVLRALKNLRFSAGGATIYIEEPEAHLFPIAQKRMVELLARTFNTPGNRYQIIVTTHSPYILSAFNNLLEAGKILSEKEHLKEETLKIIPEEEIIYPNDLIAYSIDQGDKKVIIDQSSKLISQNILDSVSDEISNEFGNLINLDY
jgi:predicted ATP-binding protein involved in virulence